MKTILKAGAVLSVLALAAYGTESNAQEPTGVHVIPLAQDGDVLDAVDHDEAVGHDDLSNYSGLGDGALTQISAPTNTSTQTDNDIVVDNGGVLMTGLTEGATNNNGGINTFFQNTGPGANFQNSTTVQVIMGDTPSP